MHQVIDLIGGNISYLQSIFLKVPLFFQTVSKDEMASVGNLRCVLGL